MGLIVPVRKTETRLIRLNRLPAKREEFELCVKALTREEEEETVEDTISAILKILKEKKGAFWIAEKRGECVGYLFTEKRETIYGKRIGIICQVYMNLRKIGRSMIYEIEMVTDRWAKDEGLEELMFMTDRHPVAFMKQLHFNWKANSALFKRCV